MSIRVLLADDQALVRSGFRLILETREDLEVVGEAENGREAVELARRLNPDVILMDVRMPDVDGVEATRRLTALGSPARVLILTTFDLDEYVYEALRAGASGFRSRTCSPPSSSTPSAWSPPARPCSRPPSRGACWTTSARSSGRPGPRPSSPA
jgi:DNA-binding NarL/FixJ family response regulator